MAGSFSPVLQEAEARIYPIGGYEDSSARYLGQRVGQLLETGANVFASVRSEENRLRPYAEQLEKIRQMSEQTDDNGRPIVSNQRVRSDISAVISQAYITGGEEIGRQLAGAADNIFGGTLGSFTNDRIRQAEEEFIGAALDKGMVLLPEGTPEEQFAAGLRHQQLEQEQETVKARLELARSQLSYDDQRRQAAEAEAVRGTWSVVQKGMNEVLAPFLRSIATTDFTDPTAMAEAKKALVLKEAEMRAWVNQLAAETGLNPSDTATLLERTTQQITSVSDGLEALGAIPADQIELISNMFLLDEIRTGTSIGNSVKLLGRVGFADAFVQSGLLQSGELRAVMGQDALRTLLPGEAGPEDAAEVILNSVRNRDPSNPAANQFAVQMLNVNLQEDDPTSINNFALATRHIAGNAAGSVTLDTKLTALDEMSTRRFLENLDTAQYSVDPRLMADTVTDYYAFLNHINAVSLVELQRIDQTYDGITVDYETGAVEWDGVLASVGQVGSAVANPPTALTTQPLGIGRGIAGGLEVGRQVDEYQAFAQARRLGEVVQRTNDLRNFVDTKLGDYNRINRIVRQESGGNPRAVSPRGARGLMQVMPDTAREVSSSLDLGLENLRNEELQARLTDDPELNKTLGIEYYRQQLATFRETELALAAYNAGPGRVRQWLELNGDPRTGEVTMEEWVERIPFRETKNYVKSITQ